LSLVTDRVAHPSERINEILHLQGRFKIWSKLDLADGFHQMPFKIEHMRLTCTTTPKGVFHWTVLILCLKNAEGQFQRMLEWVFKDKPSVDPYIDDFIFGSTGGNVEELLNNDLTDVIRVLEVMGKIQMICSPRKSKFF